MADANGQIAQVLAQIDETLATIGNDRTHPLHVLVYVTGLGDAATLNELWDAWVPTGHPLVRAIGQDGLAGTYKVDTVVTAAFRGVLTQAIEANRPYAPLVARR